MGSLGSGAPLVDARLLANAITTELWLVDAVDATTTILAGAGGARSTARQATALGASSRLHGQKEGHLPIRAKSQDVIPCGPARGWPEGPDPPPPVNEDGPGPRSLVPLDVL